MTLSEKTNKTSHLIDSVFENELASILRLISEETKIMFFSESLVDNERLIPLLRVLRKSNLKKYSLKTIFNSIFETADLTSAKPILETQVKTMGIKNTILFMEEKSLENPKLLLNYWYYLVGYIDDSEQDAIDAIVRMKNNIDMAQNTFSEIEGKYWTNLKENLSR